MKSIVKTLKLTWTSRHTEAF